MQPLVRNLPCAAADSPPRRFLTVKPELKFKWLGSYEGDSEPLHSFISTRVLSVHFPETSLTDLHLALASERLERESFHRFINSARDARVR